MNSEGTLFSIFSLPCFPLILRFCITFSFFSLLSKTVLCSVNPHFSVCEPKFCGGLKISFPFFINGLHELFCGYPGFDVYCDQNGTASINISNTLYTILDINFDIQQLIVSNALYSTGEANMSACLPFTNNITLPSDGRFQFTPNQTHLFLLFGCDPSSLPQTLHHYIVGYGCPASNNMNKTGALLALSEESDTNMSYGSENCTVGKANVPMVTGFGGTNISRESVVINGCSTSISTNKSKTGAVLALSEEFDANMSYVSENCRDGKVMNLPMVTGFGGTNISKESVVAKLRNGFGLNWEASNCTSCTASGGRCGFDSDTYHFQCFCSDGTHANTCTTKPPHTEKKTYVMVRDVMVAVTAAGLVIFVITVWLLRRRLRHLLRYFWRKQSQSHQDIEGFLRSHGHLNLRRYRYSDIKKITNSFRSKLGQGGYGRVYKGKLRDGSVVAVKVLNEKKGNGEEFINEVASISRTSHVNIVTLLGFCFDGSKRALIYEFLPNGSLEKYISEEKPLKSDFRLDCNTMYGIAVGVARGLEYLHRGCNTRIFHFDIKPHNILLDEDFIPKISDFGLAKICPRKDSIVSMLGARGTVGYIAPEVYCRNIGPVSHKSDVYSFGMMILEMVGGRKKTEAQVDDTSEIYFPDWIYKRLESNQELALGNTENEGDREIIRKMVIVSLWCIQTYPRDRPTMGRVLEMLEGSLLALQLPSRSDATALGNDFSGSPFRYCSSSSKLHTNLSSQS